MRNKDIRPEWIPSAYRDEVKDEGRNYAKIQSVSSTLYFGKGIYTKQGFKRKSSK